MKSTRLYLAYTMIFALMLTVSATSAFAASLAHSSTEISSAPPSLAPAQVNLYKSSPTLVAGPCLPKPTQGSGTTSSSGFKQPTLVAGPARHTPTNSGTSSGSAFKQPTLIAGPCLPKPTSGGTSSGTAFKQPTLVAGPCLPKPTSGGTTSGTAFQMPTLSA